MLKYNKNVKFYYIVDNKMSVIQPQASNYGATGITGTWTSQWFQPYGYASLTFSWLSDVDTTVDINQSPDESTNLFVSSFAGVGGTAQNQLVNVKSEFIQIVVTFISPPSTFFFETFANSFFFSPNVVGPTAGSTGAYGALSDSSVTPDSGNNLFPLHLVDQLYNMDTPSPGTLQISVAGTYLCQGLLSYTLPASTQLNIFMKANGSLVNSTISEVTLDNQEDNVMSTIALLTLDVGDTVELWYNTADPGSTVFSIVNFVVTLQSGSTFGPTGPQGPTGPTNGPTGPIGPTGLNTTYALLDVATADGTTGTYSFNTINQSYNHLKIILTAASDMFVGNPPDVNFRFNGDTGTNYYWLQQYVINSGFFSAADGTQSYGRIGVLNDNISTPKIFSPISCSIYNYTNPNIYKESLSKSSSLNNSSGNTFLFAFGTEWRSTSAITDIDVMLGPGDGSEGNFVAGSQIFLYGKI
jgi:hypothetical protein